MKPCFGYVRVSTQKQGEGVSLDAQREAITAFASRHDLTISRWFEEKETAAKGGRPLFNQMLQLLIRGAAEGLIMHKIDRSARNLRDWAAISDLSDAGIDVHFATESLDFRSRGGRLTADIQAVIAADYIRNLREETIKGLTGRLKQGLYPFRAPIGYRDNGRGQVKTPCPVKAPLVREAFRLYASGRHSMRSLQAELQRIGLVSHGRGPLSLHGVETMLRNPFYVGQIEIRRTGATYPGVHEPLIDLGTFRRVQDVRAGKAGKKVTRHNHLYRGLFRCGLCDGPMTPERQKGIVYYRCQNPTCETRCVREDALETAIIDALKALQLSEADAAKFEADWRAWQDGAARSDAIRSLELRLAQARERRERLAELLLDRVIDQEDFPLQKQRLTAQIDDLAESLRRLTENDLPAERVQRFLELMKNLAELHIQAEPAEKRSLVENAFSNRRVCGKYVELEPSNLIRERDFVRLSPLVTHIDTLIELANPKPIKEPVPLTTDPSIPQWKYNLKNQRLDDLQNAA